MKTKTKAVLAIIIATQAMLLAACNTTAGAGKDIKSAGGAIEKSADDAKR
jgi:predicted small secreted protein